MADALPGNTRYDAQPYMLPCFNLIIRCFMYKCLYELTLEPCYQLLLSVKSLLMFEQSESVLSLRTFVNINQRCLFQLVKNPE